MTTKTARKKGARKATEKGGSRARGRTEEKREGNRTWVLTYPEAEDSRKDITAVCKQRGGVLFVGFAVKNGNDLPRVGDGVAVARHRMKGHPNYRFNERVRNWNGKRVILREPDWPHRITHRRIHRELRKEIYALAGMPCDSITSRTIRNNYALAIGEEHGVSVKDPNVTTFGSVTSSPL